MTNKDRAVELAEKLVALQGHVDALKFVLREKFKWSSQQMANLDSAVFDQESRTRLDESFRERSKELKQAIEQTKDDDSLIGILHAEAFGKLTV